MNEYLFNVLKNFVRYAKDGNLLLIDSWGKHYLNSEDSNEETKTAVKIIMENRGLYEPNHLVPGAILKIIDSFQKDFASLSKELIDETIQDTYEALNMYMENILSIISCDRLSVENEFLQEKCILMPEEIKSIMKNVFGEDMTNSSILSNIFRKDSVLYAIDSEYFGKSTLKWGVSRKFKKCETSSSAAKKTPKYDKEQLTQAWLRPAQVYCKACNTTIDAPIDTREQLLTLPARELYLLFARMNYGRSYWYFDEFDEEYQKIITQCSDMEKAFFWNNMETVALEVESTDLSEYVLRYWPRSQKLAWSYLELKTERFSLYDFKPKNELLKRKKSLSKYQLSQVEEKYQWFQRKFLTMCELTKLFEQMFPNAESSHPEYYEQWQEYSTGMKALKDKEDAHHLAIMRRHNKNLWREKPLSEKINNIFRKS